MTLQKRGGRTRYSFHRATRIVNNLSVYNRLNGLVYYSKDRFGLDSICNMNQSTYTFIIYTRVAFIHMIVNICVFSIEQ